MDKVDRTISQAEEEIRVLLDQVQRAYARGESPAEIMQIWYDPDDLIVVGQGDKHAHRGYAANLAEAIEKGPLLGIRPEITFTINSPIVASQDLAVVMLDCTLVPDYPAADTLQLRLLTAWKYGSHGWRITREMYCEGTL